MKLAFQYSGILLILFVLMSAGNIFTLGHSFSIPQVSVSVHRTGDEGCRSCGADSSADSICSICCGQSCRRSGPGCPDMGLTCHGGVWWSAVSMANGQKWSFSNIWFLKYFIITLLTFHIFIFNCFSSFHYILINTLYIDRPGTKIKAQTLRLAQVHIIGMCRRQA